MALDITGSLVALVTPMQENGDIDFPAFDRLVDWHVKAGTGAMETSADWSTFDFSTTLRVLPTAPEASVRRTLRKLHLNTCATCSKQQEFHSARSRSCQKSS